MKKILSSILAAALMLTTLWSTAFTVYATGSGSCGTNGDNVLWSLTSNGTLTISQGSGSEARMTDFVNNGLSRPGWYDMRGEITKIVIEEGVINIGAYAFDHCYNLTEVDFGSIDTIGNNAFMNCYALQTVELPGSFNWMYNAVFEGCTALKYAYLGERWWTEGTVPSYFFKNCTALRAVRLGSKFTGFETGVFDGCTNMKVIISNNESLTYDGLTVARTYVLSGTCSDNTYSQKTLTYALDTDTFTLKFSGSGDMSSTPWSDAKDIIENVSFAGTDAKTSISTTAFNGYTALTSVDFTNIYAIGWGAFGEDANLGSISFDSTLTDIWGWAFSACTSIDQIRFAEGTGDLHIREHAFDGCTGTTFWVDLPSNTKYIDEGAFYNTGFNYIKILNPDAQIGNDAFGDGNGGWAQFLSVAHTHTTTYDFVKANRKKGYNWKYWCIGDNEHEYADVTVAPTCTENGYDRYGCLYCDGDEYKSNFVPALGHDLKCTGTENGNFTYLCRRCSEDFAYSAYEPMHYFKDAISTSDDVYHQENYDARVDVNADGYINGRDWAIITTNIQNVDTTSKATVIDKSTTFQTIEGWGASGAWWSPEVGTWENADDIVRLLYSRNEGIGLNIYRYNLGAGSQDDSSLYNTGTRTRCFLQEDGTYNWDNDPGTMNILSLANQFCPNVKVELFSNSAPVYMTSNGRAYQSPLMDGETEVCNLPESSFTDFANFTVTCAEHFLDEGYNVTEVSPINEPEWTWAGWYNGDGSISCGQEGCHFDPADARTFYNNAMVPALQASSKLNGKVDLAVWECAQLNHSWWFNGFLDYLFSKEAQTKDWLGRTSGTEYAAYNSNIRAYTNTLDTHSYWATASDRNAVMQKLDTDNYRSVQKIKCSEYCQMYNDGSSGVVGHTQAAGGSTNGMGIDYGLAMADIIYQDMTILNAVEWDWWTACGKGVYTDSLVYVDADNHDNIQTAKRLWCLGNYSKFIREGATRIKVTTGSQLGANLYTKPENIYTWKDGDNRGTDAYNYLHTSAYLNPDGTIAIVYINNSDSIEYTSISATDYTSFKSYVTDETKDLELYQQGSISDAVCIPARSCTTVVLSQDSHYLFAYFTGNDYTEQRIRFAGSNGGIKFYALNNGTEVVTQTKGKLCCRDPYIFKGQDDYYYLIATDMDCATGWWGNSNTMILWRSKDLVNWTDETIINMSEITGAPDIQRCWAPQVLWDESKQKYMVYFALASWSITQNVTDMYYCYTDDLLDQSAYSYPQVLLHTGKTFVNDNNETVQSSSIDGDITEYNGTYYMFYKDESNATICVVTSDTMNGGYSSADEVVLNTSFNDGLAEGLEGCQVYREANGDYIFIADRYGANGTFAAFNFGKDIAKTLNNIKNGTSVMNYYSLILTQRLSNLSPRHGSMLTISGDEYDNLLNNF